MLTREDMPDAAVHAMLALLFDAIGETPIEQRPSAETAPVLAERWYHQFNGGERITQSRAVQLTLPN